MLQTDILLVEVDLDEVLILEVFIVVFDDADFDIIRELADVLALLDFEDDAVFDKLETLKDKLVLAVGSTFEEDVFLDRVLEDVDLEDTLEEEVVFEEDEKTSEPLEYEEELLLDVDKVVGEGLCKAGQRDAECCPVSVVVTTTVSVVP